MIKYYRIESIRQERTPGIKPGWSNYKFNPVANALKYLVEAGQLYDKQIPRKWYGKPHLEVKVVGVYDEEQAYVSIEGTRKDIDAFLQKACLADGFNASWSWGEVEKWRMELRLK